MRNKVIDRWDNAALGINLRHLHAFSAVAAAGSIARAADGLFRVPSAVTRSVLQLEGALGRPLFDRGSRGVALNAYGELVLVRVQRIERERFTVPVAQRERRCPVADAGRQSRGVDDSKSGGECRAAHHGRAGCDRLMSAWRARGATVH